MKVFVENSINAKKNPQNQNNKKPPQNSSLELE